MWYFYDSMWVLLTLDFCFMLVGSSLAVKHALIRERSAVHESVVIPQFIKKQVAHSSAGGESLPAAIVQENLSCTEPSQLFHVEPFVLLNRNP